MSQAPRVRGGQAGDHRLTLVMWLKLGKLDVACCLAELSDYVQHEAESVEVKDFRSRDKQGALLALARDLAKLSDIANDETI